MEPQEYTERTCIIVIEAFLKDSMRTMGVIVDNVSEVVSISADTIDPPPEYNSGVDNAATILGIAKIAENNKAIKFNVDASFEKICSLNCNNL